jgi:hypothetical protein
VLHVEEASLAQRNVRLALQVRDHLLSGVLVLADDGMIAHAQQV